MSDRTIHLTVLLDNEYRDDDAAPIIEAIKMIKGVRQVKMNVKDANHFIAYERARLNLSEQLWAALRPKEET